jgi:hypothetical protein
VTCTDGSRSMSKREQSAALVFSKDPGAVAELSTR